MLDRTVILIIEDEQLFVDLMDSFSPQRYTLVFASNFAEARTQCGPPTPRLVIARATDLGAELKALLDSARSRGAKLLGLTLPDVEADFGFDHVARRDDLVQVVLEARDLVQERRRSPRAEMTFPVEVAQMGTVTVTRISSRSMFIPGESTLEPGQEVLIEVASGKQVLACNARVVRKATGDAAEAGTVLEIPDEARDMQQLFDALVRQSIMLQHLQQQPPAMPGGSPTLSITRKMVSHTRQLIDETRRWRDTVETPKLTLPPTAPAAIQAIPTNSATEADLEALAAEWEALASELEKGDS